MIIINGRATQHSCHSSASTGLPYAYELHEAYREAHLRHFDAIARTMNATISI